MSGLVSEFRNLDVPSLKDMDDVSYDGDKIIVKYKNGGEAGFGLNIKTPDDMRKLINVMAVDAVGDKRRGSSKKSGRVEGEPNEELEKIRREQEKMKKKSEFDFDVSKIGPMNEDVNSPLARKVPFETIRWMMR